MEPLTRNGATFRCKVCNRDLPETMKAPAWTKGRETIDLRRCKPCNTQLAQWNTRLKNTGSGVVPTVQRRPRRKGRGR